VFPKLVAPDPSFHRLETRPEWLLDYEVELAVVFDRDIRNESDLAAAQAGLFVINDFTDRATLIREIDLSIPDVGGGFANSKGQPGFLPTGPFVVVPQDWRAFLRELEIRLEVNGKQRQQASPAELIWNVDEIVRRALALEGQSHWVHDGRPVTLLDDGIPKGMAILTGTPGGVVFNAPTNGFIARGIAGWLFGFHFLDQGATAHVQERLIDDTRSQGIYLQPGDEVEASARWLGRIETKVVAPPSAHARAGGVGTPAARQTVPHPPERGP
jgi:2-keto-4-pentenoate hydratase/2-oxohepta-3-ene-1,7-dioic acid hydratase in catechol pathway